MMSAQELLARHGIPYVSTKKSSYTTNCPNCSQGYLNVKIDKDGVVWNCRSCDERGGESFERHERKASSLGPIKAVFDYTDEGGELLFQALRFEPHGRPKEFRQRTGPDQKKWSIEGVRIVPFRLPELIADIASERTIFVVEGEKDVNTLRSHDVPATCNPMGAGKWWPEFNEILRGANVVICGDNDPPGRDHVKLVAKNLYGIVSRLRVLDLKEFWPEIEESDDVSDWFIAGGTVEKLWGFVEQLEEWTPPANGADEQPPWEEQKEKHDEHSAADEGLGECDAGDDTEKPPPRHWLLGNQFCRKFLSGLFAPGATGKSALRLAQYLSLATGRELTGEHVFRRCRVLVVSLEDDHDEMRRRILAARLHYNISLDELKGWLFYATPKGLKLAEMKGGSRQIGLLEKRLRAAIERRKPDLVGLDPFVKLHALEENDNGAMDFVADLLVTLAIEYDIAVDAPHHTKKGQLTPGDADSGRGASSMRDAGRLMYTLSTMDEAEAKAFGIDPEQRHAYVRLDKGKVNLVPPARTATWFKLVGIRLDNGTADYPNGDEVQTVEPWKPPKIWEGLSSVSLNAALTDIDAGLENGQRYSSAPPARDRAAWRVVQGHCPDRTEQQCREIIRAWIKNGVLYDDDYDDPVDRKTRRGLRLDPAKRPS